MLSFGEEMYISQHTFENSLEDQENFSSKKKLVRFSAPYRRDKFKIDDNFYLNLAAPIYIHLNTSKIIFLYHSWRK